MKNIKNKPRLAAIISACFIAGLVLSPVGAEAGRLITGKQIKDNTVTTKDIKNKTITEKDLSAAVKNKFKPKTVIKEVPVKKEAVKIVGYNPTLGAYTGLFEGDGTASVGGVRAPELGYFGITPNADWDVVITVAFSSNHWANQPNPTQFPAKSSTKVACGFSTGTSTASQADVDANNWDSVSTPGLGIWKNAYGVKEYDVPNDGSINVEYRLSIPKADVPQLENGGRWGCWNKEPTRYQAMSHYSIAGGAVGY